MRIFIIENDNNITVFASHREAKASQAEGSECFSTEEELAQLAASPHHPRASTERI